jgi:uncharacterized membrane protein
MSSAGSDTALADLSLKLLGKDLADVDAEEHRVLRSIVERSLISRDAMDFADEQASFGERLSDRVARVGGSWAFIIVFSLVLLGWMILNSEILGRWHEAFDPFPYIFLNLMLSTIAAVQAPVIMMSQNRQAAKDRLAASLDYQINLRAELEIMRLHEKIDALQMERLEERIDSLTAAVEKLGPRGTN